MGPEVTIHNPFQLRFELFERSHQSVELTEPGRRFVEEAHEAVMHRESAVSSANAAFRGAEETLNIGATAATDPFLVSTLTAVRVLHLRKSGYAA